MAAFRQQLELERQKQLQLEQERHGDDGEVGFEAGGVGSRGPVHHRLWTYLKNTWFGVLARSGERHPWIER